jgi:AraC family transcriptional regulator
MQSPSTLIFASPLLKIGRFCCPVQHPHFQDTGPIVSGHLIVFPRTSVYIHHADAPPIVADPNLVLFYNLHQTYRRASLSAEGDRCEWFAFAPEILLNAIQEYEPHVVEQPEQPFAFTHALSKPQIYLRQRQVFEHIRQAPQPDLLYVEETMLLTLAMLLAHVYRHRRKEQRRPRPATYRQQLAIIQAIQAELGIRFQEKLLLKELATKVYMSPYELCRIFRIHTGCTIHQYLNQLRLCTALETVTTSSADLTELALNLGYNSHSHFTSAFRKVFDITPRMLRAAVTDKYARI